MRQAVEKATGCRATYFNSETPRADVFGEEFARAVETYALDGEAVSSRAFVWKREDKVDGTDPGYTVIFKAGIFTAEAAVKSVANSIRKRMTAPD